MIKVKFSKRHKCKVYRLDATVNGVRFRRFFLKKSEAEAVAYKIKHDAIARRYGLPVMAERPLLSELVEKRLKVLEGSKEETRATRVLNDLVALMPQGYCVDELTKADIQRYVDKRRADRLKAQSIDRELNIIGAMLNQIDSFYPSLEQWRPPRLPRPKIIGGRRERIWTDSEREAILDELCAPRRKGEQAQSYHARYRVGLKVQFCLLNGVRHGEMNLIEIRNVNWRERTIKIYQGKTGKYKTIGPVGSTTMEILKLFAQSSESKYVFSKGGNITPKFYRILRRACEAVGVPYGKNTESGLILHDARHTATTYMLEDGVSPKVVQEWMGWADSSFVLYYSHSTKKSREQAGEFLERRFGKKLA